MFDALLTGEGRTLLVATLVVVGTLAFEAWLSACWGRAWFTLAVPLGDDLVPLQHLPAGRGQGRGVAWRVVDEVVLLYRVGRDAAPRGLHGVVYLLPARGGQVHLDVRWAPPWTPLAAIAWLSVLGTIRGEGAVLVPVSTLLAGALLLAYWQAARRVAASLRQALVEASG